MKLYIINQHNKIYQSQFIQIIGLLSTAYYMFMQFHPSAKKMGGILTYGQFIIFNLLPSRE